MQRSFSLLNASLLFLFIVASGLLKPFARPPTVVFVALGKVLNHFVLNMFLGRYPGTNQAHDQVITLPVVEQAVPFTRLTKVSELVDGPAYQITCYWGVCSVPHSGPSLSPCS